MKKILCFIISIILIFSLASCDNASDKGKKPASTPIVVPSPTPAPTSEDMSRLAPMLEEIEDSSKTELGDNVLKMTTNIVMDIVYTGMEIKTSEQTVTYTKDTADSKILSQEIKTVVPTEPEQIASFYFENDYMYTATDAGVTIKFESPVDKVLEAIWEESFIDISTLADVAKDVTINVDTEGKYDIIIEIDVSKDSAYIDNFITQMVDEKMSDNLTKCTVKITTTEDSFMDSISIEFKATQEKADIGTVHITSDIAVAVDILAPDYKIPVPAGIDIDNAMTEEEYLENIFIANPTVENLLNIVNYRSSVAYDQKTIKTTMSRDVDITYDSQKAKTSMDMCGYVKYADDDSVVSMEYTIDNNYEIDNYSIYYTDGYLYLSSFGETYKYESSLQEAFPSELSLQLKDLDYMFIAPKDASLEKQTDGSYKVYITIDTTKESTFLSKVIESMADIVYAPTVNSYKVFYHITEDYLVDAAEIEYNISGQQSFADDVNLAYKEMFTTEFLDDNYVIQPPEGVDIDNAITEDEYL